MAEARTLGQGERRSSKAGHRVGFDFRVGAMGDLKKKIVATSISDQRSGGALGGAIEGGHKA